MAIIKITVKCNDNDCSGISSYYYTEKDNQKLSAFADAINSTAGSDIKVKIIANPKEFVPVSIRLEDRDVRYFDIDDMFRDSHSRLSQYTINKIAEECAFNEQYCNFIGDHAVSLTTVESTAYIGKAIADTILTRAMKILNDHKDRINKCFCEFNKAAVQAFNWDEEKSIDYACAKSNAAIGVDIGQNSAIGVQVSPNAAIGTSSWEIPNEAPKIKKVPMPDKTSNN